MNSATTDLMNVAAFMFVRLTAPPNEVLGEAFVDIAKICRLHHIHSEFVIPIFVEDPHNHCTCHLYGEKTVVPPVTDCTVVDGSSETGLRWAIGGLTGLRAVSPSRRISRRNR